ncbi:MAG: dihydropteroate synthase [Pseudomonadota bacterium]
MDAKWFEPRQWPLAHGRSLKLGPKAHIMAILNVTPDSFSDGGKWQGVDGALKAAEAMAEEGATIIDIGGESTRPGAEPVLPQEEQDRILPVIERMADRLDTAISVDTYRAETARAAVNTGAHIINDIWGLHHDPAMATVAAETGAGLVLMYNRRGRAVGDDIHADAGVFFAGSLKKAAHAGVQSEAITLDPGFGFSDDAGDSIPLLNGFEKLHNAHHPLLVGTSRKRFLGTITGRDAVERDTATAATSVVARLKGAALFRVHNVAANADALKVTDALIAGRTES